MTTPLKDSETLSDLYPLDMAREDLAALTEYKLHRLPWKVVEVDDREVTAVSADRLYMAHVYLLHGEDMYVQARRHYSDRRSLIRYEGSYAQLQAMDKNSLQARLLTLAGQIPKDRLGELIHLHHGIHTAACPKPCPYVALPTKMAMLETLLEDAPMKQAMRTALLQEIVY